MTSFRLARPTTNLLARTQLRAVVRPTSFTQSRFASQDYGSGAGDPKGEKPQDQGPNPSEKLEHPGAPPPSTGDMGKGAEKGQDGQKK